MDNEICQAYGYLLGRLLVLRQQRLDFEGEGMDWNRLDHRDPGGVSWVNPNLDVAYSEAWVAVGEAGGAMLEIPPIEDRYFTWQMLDGWGETLLNINERTFPDHPSGRFALCLAGSGVAVPDGAVRIDLPVRASRVLMRVELGSDPAEAVRLQHAFTLTPFGDPRPPQRIEAPLFGNRELPGVDAFDLAPAILAAGDDDGMAEPRAAVTEVAELLRSDPAAREWVDRVIAEQARPELRRRLQSVGRIENGWMCPTVIGRYGGDYWMRTVANLTGIWANTTDEYLGFVATGRDGGAVHTVTYPPERLPGSAARYFWSVTAVDSRDFLVIPNPIDRHALGSRSPLEHNVDGSLTLVFAPSRPADHPGANWLPTPDGGRYNLTYRVYGPRDPDYVPPPLERR